MSRILQKISICSFVFTTLLFGAKPSEHLHQDIHILEGVLEKILQDEAALYQINGNINGLYLENYGVLFHTERVAPSQVIIMSSLKESTDEIRKHQAEMKAHIKEMEIRRKAMKDEQKALQEKIKVMITTGDDGVEKETRVETFVLPELDLNHSKEMMKEKQDKAVQILEDKIRRFLEKYASTLDGLASKSRVAVMIQLDHWYPESNKDDFLLGWISYQDIQRYREQKISLNQFQEKIHIQRSDGQNGIQEEIAIMTEILNRGTQSGNNPEFTQWTGSNTGMYMNGLGALFFVDNPHLFWHGDSSNGIRFLHSNDGDQYIYRLNSRKRESRDASKQIDAVKSSIVHSMAKYGHTLSIDPSENIIIYLDLNQYITDPSNAIPGHMLLQIKKADADAFYRGAITFDEFQKRLISQ